MQWNDWLTILCVVPGAVLALGGAIGVLRMPDFYTRLHPAGKSDTLAQLLIMLGLSFQVFDEGTTTPGLTLSRLILISAILFVTAPTATHAITKAAHLDGLKPWEPGHPVPPEASSSADHDADLAARPDSPPADSDEPPRPSATPGHDV